MANVNLQDELLLLSFILILIIYLFIYNYWMERNYPSFLNWTVADLSQALLWLLKVVSQLFKHLHRASLLASVAACPFTWSLREASHTQSNQCRNRLAWLRQTCQNVGRMLKSAVIMHCLPLHLPLFIMLDKHSFGIWWGKCQQLRDKFNYTYHNFVIWRGAVKHTMELEPFFPISLFF